MHCSRKYPLCITLQSRKKFSKQFWFSLLVSVYVFCRSVYSNKTITALCCLYHTLEQGDLNVFDWSFCFAILRKDSKPFFKLSILWELLFARALFWGFWEYIILIFTESNNEFTGIWQECSSRKSTIFDWTQKRQYDWKIVLTRLFLKIIWIEMHIYQQSTSLLCWKIYQSHVLIIFFKSE